MLVDGDREGSIDSCMRTTLACLVLMLAACASDPGVGRRPAYAISDYSSNVLADEPLCEHAVTNFEKADSFSAAEASSNRLYFNPRAEAAARHRDRVKRCTSSLSQRQAACIAQAQSLQHVRNCSNSAELQ